jgi:integrase
MKGYITRGRSAGTWYLRVELTPSDNGKRRQRRETVRGAKADAQHRLRDLLREVEGGGYAGSDRHTVAELAKRWLATKEHRVAAKTYAFYAAHVRLYIVPAFGSLRAESLRPSHVEAALAAWARAKRNDRERGTLSSRSVAHLFSTLRTFLRWGVKMGLLVRNAADAVDPPRFERKEMRALDAAGVARLLRAAHGSELQAIIAVAVGTGLRRGELLALRWPDVSLDARRLTVRRSLETVKGVTRTKAPKTARSARTIALPPFVASVLRKALNHQEELCRASGMKQTEDRWVFARADGSPWEPGAFSLAFARLVKNSKLPHIRFHDLRHSFGTLALASGVDLQTVSRALGHESTAITSRIYLHAIDTLQDDAAARIDALLGNAVAGALAKPPIPVSPAVTLRQAQGDKESVPQPCHKRSRQTKNARRFERFVVAPTGIEPVIRGPGRSRRIPESPFQYGFSRF